MLISNYVLLYIEEENHWLCEILNAGVPAERVKQISHYSFE
jgi:hypothetical protein